MPGSADSKLTQAEAQARLEQLKADINRLRKELEKSRSTLNSEQQALRTTDLEIQASALSLRELETSKQSHETQLTSLNSNRQEYLRSLDQRREKLARQILTAYRLGRESRLKLVLNQDSPAMLSRTLAYYDYFSRSQAKQISELMEVLQTLDGMQKEINRELQAIDGVQKEQQAVLDEMTRQRDDRQQIISALASQIRTDEAHLTELQRNRQDLETLLEKLANVLADIPADLGSQSGPQGLKGKLPMPVDGPVKAAFGQARTAGLSWHGWLIGAGNGSEVRAIAHGRVAYSDWLRGYGLLMIIDHGDGYMSLYGNNESLLHEVGDWVEPGAPISTVGSSSLNGDGLYFEIRKNGKAMDPAVWLRR